MKPSLIKLQKFFKLEAERGYDNRAVLGGLERMLEPWEAEARSEGVSEEIITVVVNRLRDYNHLSPASRQESLQGLWRRIQRESGDAESAAPEATGEPPEASSLQETGENQTPEVEIELDVEVESGPAAVETFSLPERPGPQTGPLHQAVPVAGGTPAALNASVTVLPGVGARHGETLGRLGMKTLGDMLFYFPRRYDDYSQLKTINRLWYGEEVTIIGTVQNVTNRQVRNGRMSITEAVISDGSGALRVTWFNQPWIGKRLRNGMQVVLSGKVEQYLGRLVMNSPEVEQLEQQNLHTNRIVPVYPLTANITQRWLRRLMYQVVTYWSPRVQDPLPRTTRRAAEVIDLQTALQQIHFPDSWEALKAARSRLAFDELFLLQLGLLGQKRTWQERSARTFETPQDWLEQQIADLPFALTDAQARVVEQIRADLGRGHPMNRLLQGDVGSGKTVIAALTIAMVVCHSPQAALMAPTSILAEQHYQNLSQLLSGEDRLLPADQVRLLIGATPEAEKQAIRDGLASGEIKVVIGTHALIEDPVVFADLELAIIDEQHRFGVEQRAALRQKGRDPHLIVMSATPIPRSLALTVYGDLDLLVLDEMPPGRQPVSTHVLLPRERERAYSLVRSHVERGCQAFIIYPLIEQDGENPADDPVNESKAAVDEHHRLQEVIFPQLKLGLLHGRLRPEEKDDVMERFRSGEYEILVSTSVVEVGVDVPNATVMLVEGADRFGLAQLHQFRGRVGRGQEQAYCLLIPATDDAAENERLSSMVETNDGFVLAERDLQQRGPGDFLGTRQSGYVQQLRLASLTDIHLIEKSQQLAKSIFEQDPELNLPEHQPLNVALRRAWGESGPSVSGDVS